MNALKVREALRRKEAKELSEKLVREAAQKATNQLAEQNDRVARDKALLYMFRVLYVMHRNPLFRFGRKRLIRLYNAICDDGEQFVKDCEDGIVWSVMFREFDSLGLKFAELEKRREYLIKYGQRIFEKGVKHYGEDIVEPKEIYEKAVK